MDGLIQDGTHIRTEVRNRRHLARETCEVAEPPHRLHLRALFEVARDRDQINGHSLVGQVKEAAVQETMRLLAEMLRIQTVLARLMDALGMKKDRAQQCALGDRILWFSPQSCGTRLSHRTASLLRAILTTQDTILHVRAGPEKSKFSPTAGGPGTTDSTSKNTLRQTS